MAQEHFMTFQRLLPLSLSSLLVLAWLAPPSLEAQRAPGAHPVAAQEQGVYAQSQSLEARFFQTYYHRAYRRYVRSSGRIRLAKPGRLRFDYARPNGKVVASDGESLVAYEPGEDGAPGQYAETQVSGALSTAFGFLMGTSRIERDYRVRLLSSSRYHTRDHVLELRPRRADPRIRRVLLFVDSRPQLAGVIRRLRIDDHEGNRNKFELTRQRFDRPIPEARFAFTPPAGARRMRAPAR
jgi:outer membrane lipoprotein carrier protein